MSAVSPMETADRSAGLGAPAADALAAGLSRSALLLAIMSAAGIALALLVRRHRLAKLRAIYRAAGAAATTYTIPMTPVSGP